MDNELLRLLDRLERSIKEVRTPTPGAASTPGMRLDGLAFLAGETMDRASQEWEKLVGRKWERYTD